MVDPTTVNPTTRMIRQFIFAPVKTPLHSMHFTTVNPTFLPRLTRQHGWSNIFSTVPSARSIRRFKFQKFCNYRITSHIRPGPYIRYKAHWRLENSEILHYIRPGPYKFVIRPPFHYKAHPGPYNGKGQDGPYNGEDGPYIGEGEDFISLFHSVSQLTSLLTTPVYPWLLCFAPGTGAFYCWNYFCTIFNLLFLLYVVCTEGTRYPR